MLENDAKSELEERIPAAEERLRLGETASGFATFGLNLNTGNWDWSPEATELFGFDPTRAGRSIAKWDTVFVDDKPKIESAIEAAFMLSSASSTRTVAYIGSPGRVTLRSFPSMRYEERFTRLPSGRRWRSDY